MASVCKLCMHDNRVDFDRRLAGGESERSVAKQAGVSPAAAHRHKEHIAQAVKAVLERRDQQAERAATSAWTQRLESAYEEARVGSAKAAAHPKLWTEGAKFIVAQIKAIDLGLRADGVLSGGEGNRTMMHVDQVVILPIAPAATQPPPTIDTQCIEVSGTPAEQSDSNPMETKDE